MIIFNWLARLWAVQDTAAQARINPDSNAAQTVGAVTAEVAETYALPLEASGGADSATVTFQTAVVKTLSIRSRDADGNAVPISIILDARAAIKGTDLLLAMSDDLDSAVSAVTVENLSTTTACTVEIIAGGDAS